MKGSSVEEWTVSTLKEHLDEVLTERDRALRDILQSSSAAIERIELRMNTIVSDHVTRREFDQLRSASQQNRGARNAFIATLGIIVTLIAVALGAMYDKQLTRSDVSEQIEHESPWAADKEGIELRLDALEKQIVLINLKLQSAKKG